METGKTGRTPAASCRFAYYVLVSQPRRRNIQLFRWWFDSHILTLYLAHVLDPYLLRLPTLAKASSKGGVPWEVALSRGHSVTQELSFLSQRSQVCRGQNKALALNMRQGLLIAFVTWFLQQRMSWTNHLDWGSSGGGVTGGAWLADWWTARSLLGIKPVHSHTTRQQVY